MRIEFKKSFAKMLDKSPEKIQEALWERLRLFEKDPYSSILHNHWLTGKYAGLKSINISGDWRAIFIEIRKENLAIFLLFGTHSQLYK